MAEYNPSWTNKIGSQRWTQRFNWNIINAEKARIGMDHHNEKPRIAYAHTASIDFAYRTLLRPTPGYPSNLRFGFASMRRQRSRVQFMSK
jgi:hypothetical protein